MSQEMPRETEYQKRVELVIIGCFGCVCWLVTVMSADIIFANSRGLEVDMSVIFVLSLLTIFFIVRGIYALKVLKSITTNENVG